MVVAKRVLRRIWNHPGNRGGRIKALLRAIGWQVFKRVFKRPLIVKFVDGFSIICFPDSGSASNIFYGNHYFDLAEMTLLRRLLREGDGFIDGGANIGVYAMLAAHLVGATGRVVAFEPFPLHAERLRQNATLNGFENLTLRRVALADRIGQVAFVTTRDVSNRIQTRTDADAETITVGSATLDASISGMPRFTIGKLDLEGSEIAALSGAAQMLSANPPALWIIEWDPGLLKKRGHEPRDLLRLLEAAGYQISAVEGDRFVPVEPADHGGNFLAAHRAALQVMEGRLRERRFVVPARWTLPQLWNARMDPR